MNLQPTVANINANLFADIRLGHIRHHMARIEDKAVDFTLVNQHGELVNLFDQLDKGPTVLVFANEIDTMENHNLLCKLGKLRFAIDKFNASLTIIASHSEAMDAYRRQCESLNVEILHDVGNHVAAQYGLIQEPVYSANEYYEDFALNGSWREQTHEQLSVSAIYAIHRNRRIVFSHVNTGHTFQINTPEILETLN